MAGGPERGARSPIARIAEGAAALGVPLANAACERLLAFLELIARWNRVHNLTAVAEPSAMVGVHLLDSLAVVPFLRGLRLSDLGSGAGLPGIPIAIARPELRVRLVEARAKRARFLRHAVRELGLANVEVFEGRAESLPAAAGEDAVVARALGRLAAIVRLAAPILAPSGLVLAMKGRLPQDEVGELPAGWRLVAVHRLTVPEVVGERHLLAVAREEPASDPARA